MSERPYMWQMVREAIEQLGSPTTHTAIRNYIRDKYPGVNDGTIGCHLTVCSVNQPSRVQYSQNKKPRLCNSQYDFLFSIGRGMVSKYDPATHGQWEIRTDEFGKLVVAQCEVIDETVDGGEPPDPGEETGDGLPFALESHLRDFLAKNIGTVRVGATPLKLYVDDNGRDGVEYPTGVGLIDILASDAAGNFIVFELKVSKGPDRAIGQVTRYMGWINTHLGAGKKVSGVIVACEIDERLKYAASMIQNVTLLEYKLRFDLSPVTLTG